ncbi:MAG: hypothetical protein L0Y44_00205 [Phycisphaerales bacterium]|nr:hypothetical protein [Phycisphaerales bacterium]MCI0629059.1 hypothetical protein [Phycisphaerales bacterium]MCI0675643.1 hypothetical protein [Phycisphaerales bacterium]
MNQHREEFRARVVLLGASNATRGLSTIVETLRLRLGSPLDIFAAIGHGRSYGMHSRVFLRSLPGILESGLWSALAESRGGATADGPALTPALSQRERETENVPTHALLTDIGNDIMYGASPQTVERWVEECVDRLDAHGARVAITMLPIDSIRSVKPWQYTIVKSIMFPTRKISFVQAMNQAGELHERLNQMAARRGVTLIECRRDWYGFDPIHILPSRWAQAWSDMFCSCAPEGESDCLLARRSFLRWLRVRSVTPQRWWLAGIRLSTSQPAGRLKDGTTISLF